MQIHCEQCGAKQNVPEEMAGRRGRRPKCKEVFLISSPEPTGQSALAQLAGSGPAWPKRAADIRGDG